jgi:gas vesicle protein
VSDQDRSSDSVLSLLAGIGLGALVGAMAALLLAPQSGADTRTQIRETADDVLGKLRDSVDDLKVKVEELASTARHAITRRGEAGADADAPLADASTSV